MKIRYIFGEFTDPYGYAPKVIINLCNTNGEWEGNDSLAVSRKWRHVKKEFHKWFKNHQKGKAVRPFELGQVQMVDITKRGWILDRNKESDTWVANILGLEGSQKGYRSSFRVSGIQKALARVASFAQANDAFIHMPKTGTKDQWTTIENLIEKEVFSKRVSVTVYDVGN
jgi:hypothetical protein